MLAVVMVVIVAVSVVIVMSVVMPVVMPVSVRLPMLVSGPVVISVPVSMTMTMTMSVPMSIAMNMLVAVQNLIGLGQRQRVHHGQRADHHPGLQRLTLDRRRRHALAEQRQAFIRIGSAQPSSAATCRIGNPYRAKPGFGKQGFQRLFVHRRELRADEFGVSGQPSGGRDCEPEMAFGPMQQASERSGRIDGKDGN